MWAKVLNLPLRLRSNCQLTLDYIIYQRKIEVIFNPKLRSKTIEKEIISSKEIISKGLRHRGRKLLTNENTADLKFYFNSLCC